MDKNLDSEIWRRFKQGDKNAFSYIFDTYHMQMFEYGHRLTSDESFIKDCIQDVFFELASKKDKLSSTNNILFYLLKSLRIRIFTNLRKNKNVSADFNDDLLADFRLEYTADVDTEEKELRLDQLAQALNQLPTRQKETIFLKFYKNLSNSEVAELMGVNYQSVGNAIQKAISKLRDIIDSDQDSIILFFQTHIR
jgi:RNA polymerase sigma-70 factor (ECF subfamily)